MKKIVVTSLVLGFILAMTALNLPPFDYQEAWKKVEQFEEDEHTQDAQRLVEEIENQASKEGNPTQTIKALLRLAKYSRTLKEDDFLTTEQAFVQAIDKNEKESKAILQNYLAQFYWNYTNQNYWTIRERTETDQSIDENDFRTWTYEKLRNRSHELFQLSLADKDDLSQLNSKDFSEILNTNTLGLEYKPSLWDVLSSHAIQFYTAERQYSNNTGNAFDYLHKGQWIVDAQNFSIQNIENLDTLFNSHFYSTKLYQSNIALHLNDKNSKALGFAEIERIESFLEASYFTDKQEKLILTLQELSEKDFLKYHYQYLLVKHNSALDNNKKVEILNSILSKSEEPWLQEKAQLILNELLSQQLSTTMDLIITANTPSRLRLNYKNINEVSYNILAITKEDYLFERGLIKKDNRATQWNEKKKVSVTKVVLKSAKDFSYHSEDLLIPALKSGFYAVQLKTNDENVVTQSVFQVSNLVLVNRNTTEGEKFYITDRIDGSSVLNCKGKVFYSSGYRNDEKTENQMLKINKKGEFILNPKDEYWRNIYFELNQNGKITVLDKNYIHRSYRVSEPQENHIVQMFTDRAIYRPGQTVYFKGIILKQKDNKSEVVPNEVGTVNLYDVNGQKIADLEVQTNEYGGFNGSVILPNNTLTGGFNLEFNGKNTELDGYHYIKVEEYKRPKFYVEIKQPKSSYKVNDKIDVTGSAPSYSGASVSQAKVQYRVVRKVNYPIWCYWRPSYSGVQEEITSGVETTDDQGNFKINFIAKPDPSINPNDFPIFNYEITVDITDQNGETRSQTQNVEVAYHVLNISVPLKSSYAKNEEVKIVASTYNLAGELINQPYQIKVVELLAPDKIFRKSQYESPSEKTWSKSEFEKLFPFDAFENENDPKSWKEGAVILDKKLTSNIDSETLNTNQKLKSAFYKVRISYTDPGGKKVEIEQIFEVLDKEGFSINPNEPVQMICEKSSFLVGENAEIIMKSAIKNQNVRVLIQKKSGTEERSFKLNGSTQSVKIPVSEQDRGGFSVQISYCFQNTFERHSLNMSVDFENKNLIFKTITFRDKLEPGTKEKWVFQFQNPDSSKAVAEVLASMYDASLDQFSANYFNFNPIRNTYFYSQSNYSSNNFESSSSGGSYTPRYEKEYINIELPQLNWFDYSWYEGGIYPLSYSSAPMMESEERSVGNGRLRSMNKSKSAEKDGLSLDMATEEVVDNAAPIVNANGATADTKMRTEISKVVPRTNLQETAFFFPALKTDESGRINLEFTTPEALTEWKLQLLAYTKELNYTVQELKTVTQKELMVSPNFPRFLRENDEVSLATKVSNITDKEMKVTVKLEMTDVVKNTSLAENLFSDKLTQEIIIGAKASKTVRWKFTVPQGLQGIECKVLASSQNHQDGEQNMVPVLSNRMLVTESLPLWISSGENKTFELSKLKNNKSNTLTHHTLTLEITSNPSWYAVQALPYLMEYPYECAEQTFSRYYANAIASYIVNKNPKIKSVFEKWKNSDALLSNLEKNQELKSLIIQETPWLRDAQSETEQKKRIALLFDLNNLTHAQQSNIDKLEEMQMSNGAWSWFKGGREDRYITQYIIGGFAHLKQLNIPLDEKCNKMINKSLNYLEQEFEEEYKNITKYNGNLSDNNLGPIQLHYLYTMQVVSKEKCGTKIAEYYLGQIDKFWQKLSLYNKALASIVSRRSSRIATSEKILTALKQNSITSPELGIYWKENTNGYYWHQNSVETQSIIIEAFTIAGAEQKTIDGLKQWLLKNKQTNRWETTKATSEAVFALLMKGGDWLNTENASSVKVGNQLISPSNEESGTGYYKKTWSSNNIKTEMANVEWKLEGKGVAWGALHWQYFEDLDKISSYNNRNTKTGLTLEKKLYKKINSTTGEKLVLITEKTPLAIGDLVRVVTLIKTDREMEYVHLKDMRASCFEPVDVLSGYNWKGGIGFYQSTRDAATNFFINYLPKGQHQFEYDLRVMTNGKFSNGISSIQCMYAPEFGAHGGGMKVISE